MEELTLDRAREVLQLLPDEMLEKVSHRADPKSAIIRQLLEERRQVAALREKYPYEVLDEMTDEELEEILWFQLLNHYPPQAVKPLLRDIFTIQDRRQGIYEPLE